MGKKRKDKVAYVVWVGRRPGVYDIWPEAEKQVHKFTGAEHRGFTWAEGGRPAAEAFLRDKVAQGAVRGNPQNDRGGGAQAEQPSTAIVDVTSLPAGPTLSQAKRQTSASPVKFQSTSRHFEQYQAQEDAPSQDEPLRVHVSGWSTSSSRIHDNHQRTSYTDPPSVPTTGSLKVNQDTVVLDESEHEADNAFLSRVESAGNGNIASDDPPSGLEAGHNARDEALAEVDSIIYKKSIPTLCPEQIDLVNLILGGKNVFYTGSAGCGKSTVLRCFQQCLRILDKRVYIVAPTGQAALDVGGTTYFLYAGWDTSMMYQPIRELCARAKKRRSLVRERLKRTDVLVIDEISMMENQHFERLNRVLQFVRENNQPFGGIQLIVTGDFCQLPPVKPFKTCLECGKELDNSGPGRRKCPECHGEILDENIWAFCSDAWRACKFAYVNLETIHRQSDVEFITILQRYRSGKTCLKDRKTLLDHRSNTKGAVKLYPKREDVDKENFKRFSQLATPIFFYECHDIFEENESHSYLQAYGKRKPLEILDEHRYIDRIELRVGMLVVLLANLDMTGGSSGLVNGSQGTIVDFQKHEEGRLPEQKGEYKGLKSACIERFTKELKKKEWPVVKFTNGREEAIYPECSISELGDRKPYALLSRTQIPLTAAWALTIHKAQGMTLPRVVVDLEKSFAEGQDYVALSRATSLEGLKVKSLPKKELRANPLVKQFYRESFGT